MGRSACKLHSILGGGGGGGGEGVSQFLIIFSGKFLPFCDWCISSFFPFFVPC